MTEIYDHDGITVDLCYYWGYIEVFGLTDKEMETLKEEGFHADADCLGNFDYDFIDEYMEDEETEGDDKSEADV